MFQGRAKARHIETDTYVLQVICYVHLNPVRAGLVLRPEDWEYSNYREWIGIKLSSPAVTAFRNFYFPSGKEYRNFVTDYVGDSDDYNIGKYVR